MLRITSPSIWEETTTLILTNSPSSEVKNTEPSVSNQATTSAKVQGLRVSSVFGVVLPRVMET